MSGKVPAPADDDDEYGSFDPGVVLKGARNGIDTTDATSGRPSATVSAQGKAPAPAAAPGNEAHAQAKTSSALVPNAVRASVPAPKLTAPSEPDNANLALQKAAHTGSPTANEPIVPAPIADAQALSLADKPAPQTYPQELFDAQALNHLARKVIYLDSWLATRLRKGATDSIVMDGPSLEQLHADFNAAHKLLAQHTKKSGAQHPDAATAPAPADVGSSTPPLAALTSPGGAAPGAPTSVVTFGTASSGAEGGPKAAAKGTAADGRPFDTDQPETAPDAGAHFEPAPAAPRSNEMAEGSVASGRMSNAGGGSAPVNAAASAAADGAAKAKGAAKGNAPGNAAGGRASDLGVAAKKSGKASGANKAATPTQEGEDAGVLGDSESSSDEEEEEIPLPDGILSSVDEVSASLEAVFAAIEHAGPRKESTARPTTSQMHALLLMEQHIRTLTEFACSRLGFSQERVLRNVADIVPARMGNDYNLFRSFMKCTDPDYKPRRDLDELLGCKPKYTTSEYKSLYPKLREKLGQEALDELLLDFDIRYPYGVPDPTRGDREKSFDMSTDRVERLFRHFAAKYDIEGFFCMVGANPAIDESRMTHWFHTFHARRFLALKLFLEEAEMKTYLQTEVQNSVTNTRAAERHVAQGRTLPLIVDLNDALGRGKKTAAVPQPRRKGRGFVAPKFNETYFDAVLEVTLSKDDRLKDSVALMSSHKGKEYLVSLPWPGGASHASSGADFNCEFTIAELNIAIIEWRRMFKEAGIPLPNGRGLQLATGFKMLITKGYMICGWPPGVYIYNESRRKTNFNGLGWHMRCLLVMYILCGYLRICKAEHITAEYLKTLPPLDVSPFRIVCITDGIPALSSIHESFHGTHRAYLDNEVVIGLHTTLVSRAIPTTVPRPESQSHPWKGVHAWNAKRRAAGESTVDSDEDVPLTAAAREVVENDEDSDENEDADEGTTEGTSKVKPKPKPKPKGMGKAASASGVRKKPAAVDSASAAGSSAPPKANSKKRKRADGDDEAANEVQAKKARQRAKTPDTDDEARRLRAKAMKKQSASNINPFPQPKRRGNLTYDDDFEDNDEESPAARNATAGPSPPADAPATADGNGKGAAPPEQDSGGAPVRAPAHDVAPDREADVESVSKGTTNGNKKDIPAVQSGGALQSPRRSQRHREKAAGSMASAPNEGANENGKDGKDGEDGEQQDDDETQRQPDHKGKAKSAKPASEDEYEEAGNENIDIDIEQSGSNTDEDEEASDGASTSGKKSKSKTRARAPASSAATSKATGRRKRGAPAGSNAEDAAPPPAKRIRRTKRFTNSSRVPKTAEYDFLFTERTPLSNQDGIIMKIKGKEISLPQQLATNAIVINALDKAARSMKLNTTELAVVQYVYDVWPTNARVSDEMNTIFRRNCKS